MKRIVLSFIALLFVSLLGFEANAKPKEQWISVRSENFTLVGNASESEIRDVAARLEQYRSVVARLFSGWNISHSVPTTVIVFKDDEAFKPFRPLYQGRFTDVAGYFQPGRDLNYIAISAEHKRDSSFGTVFHELVHLFIDGNLRGLPLCFNEGLAEYYGTLKISDGGKKVTLGKVSEQRARLLSEKELLPLQTLLATDYSSDYYNEGEKRSMFYAQSWALVHMLLERDRKTGVEQFTKLLDRLSQGASIDEGFKEVFGSDVGQIEKDLKAFVRSLPYPTNVQAFDQPFTFEKEMNSWKISDAEAQAHLGDLFLHLNRLEEAEAYLKDSLALNPNFVKAQASLGMLRVKQKRVSEAVEILRRAAALDRQNYLTQYYYAYAISREVVGEEEKVWEDQTSSVAEMRAALSRAIELSPRFVEAYRLQAFIYLVRNEELEKAEVLLKRALELSPGRQDLMLILAQVHIRRSNYVAAREDLLPVLNRAADVKLREQATALIEDIKYSESQATRADFDSMKKNEIVSSGTQQAHAGSQRLAKRFKGERIQGLLTDIQCLETGVSLTVKVDDRKLLLHATELRSVFFVTYVSGLDRTVTCGARASQNRVVLTYRALKNPRAEYDGEAIAIEFVPEDLDIEL